MSPCQSEAACTPGSESEGGLLREGRNGSWSRKGEVGYRIKLVQNKGEEEQSLGDEREKEPIVQFLKKTGDEG